MRYSVIFQVVAISISSSIILFYLNIQNSVFQLPPLVVLGIEHGTWHILGKPSTRVAPRLRPALLTSFLPAKAGTQGFVNARQAFLCELHTPLAFGFFSPLRQDWFPAYSPGYPQTPNSPAASQW